MQVPLWFPSLFTSAHGQTQGPAQSAGSFSACICSSGHVCRTQKSSTNIHRTVSQHLKHQEVDCERTDTDGVYDGDCRGPAPLLGIPCVLVGQFAVRPAPSCRRNQRIASGADCRYSVFGDCSNGSSVPILAPGGTARVQRHSVVLLKRRYCLMDPRTALPVGQTERCIEPVPLFQLAAPPGIPSGNVPNTTS